jgi:hypothetical protein
MMMSFQGKSLMMKNLNNLYLLKDPTSKIKRVKDRKSIKKMLTPMFSILLSEYWKIKE